MLRALENAGIIHSPRSSHHISLRFLIASRNVSRISFAHPTVRLRYDWLKLNFPNAFKISLNGDVECNEAIPTQVAAYIIKSLLTPHGKISHINSESIPLWSESFAIARAADESRMLSYLNFETFRRFHSAGFLKKNGLLSYLRRCILCFHLHLRPTWIMTMS